MPSKLILFSGASSVGKTAVISALLPYFQKRQKRPLVCKMDCIPSDDDKIFQKLGVPAITGLSRDVCPDHFLVSNLPELWAFAGQKGADLLLIETAGLCHRCSPATVHSIAGCVLDCMASARTSGRLGPMITQADFLVLTKADMVSQAELEILRWRLKELNPEAVVFPVDGLTGCGSELLGSWLLSRPDCASFEGDVLRHPMPAGVCSYCVGEKRVGAAFQQGVVEKIMIQEDAI
ncbi:MAG TPA: cobalamin biosynthesis protein P47K [Candidatus Copromonas faecavium]|uniref:Cobalamin biosynthesis protein P47K n=1 Tax=Candidatus Copromonas faecavium (nom. illeg.) TaxID=2840740 RepID=A0A9D1A6F5_9FIRM|nr:cobalamin biosynthesis protein P47K [Candidatus Copromonas faecavium]